MSIWGPSLRAMSRASSRRVATTRKARCCARAYGWCRSARSGSRRSMPASRAAWPTPPPGGSSRRRRASTAWKRDTRTGTTATPMKLVITAAAEADLRQIGDWIAHDSRANALAFTDDLRDRCKRLVDTPLGFPLLQRFEQAGIRCRAYRGYLILYRVRAGTI